MVCHIWVCIYIYKSIWIPKQWTYLRSQTSVWRNSWNLLALPLLSQIHLLHSSTFTTLPFLQLCAPPQKNQGRRLGIHVYEFLSHYQTFKFPDYQNRFCFASTEPDIQTFFSKRKISFFFCFLTIKAKFLPTLGIPPKYNFWALKGFFGRKAVKSALTWIENCFKSR